MSGTIKTGTMKLDGVDAIYFYADPLGTVTVNTAMNVDGVQTDYFESPAEGIIGSSTQLLDGVSTKYFSPLPTGFGGVGTTFTSTWDTTKSGSASDTIVLPYSGGNTTDWGDGTINTSRTHTYTSSGTKVVTIEGSITGFRFNNGGDRNKLITVTDTGGLVVDDSDMFWGCQNMTIWVANSSITTTTPNISKMFRECNSLITLDVTSLNVSNVRVMTNFLRDAANLQSVDVSTWDTSSAIQMPKMFLGCASLTTITGLEDFAIPLVTKMNQILLDITLPTAQYSELLINFAAQANGATFSFSGGNSKYSVGAATTARATWVASGVTITDGGQE